MRRTSALVIAACAVVVSMAACADPDFVPPKRGGSKNASAGASSAGAGGGLAGQAGSGGSNAAAGTAGSTIGGAAGVAGGGGVAGAAGVAGAGGAATAGASGSSAGASGSAGFSGSSGASGGGTAGNGGGGASGGTGSAGTGGAAGSSGAGGGAGGAGGGGGGGATAGASGSSGAAGGGGKAGGAGQAGGKAGSGTCVATAEVCDGKDNDCDGPSDEAVLPLDGGTKEHPRGACVRFTSSTGADGFPLSFATTEGDGDLGSQPRNLYYSLVFGIDGTGPFVDATVVIREPNKDNTTLVGTARVVLGGSPKTKAVLAKDVTGAASFGIAKNLVLLGTHLAGDNQTHDYMIPLENVFDGASYTSINPIVLRVVGQITPNTGPGGDATRIIVPGKSVGIELSP